MDGGVAEEGSVDEEKFILMGIECRFGVEGGRGGEEIAGAFLGALLGWAEAGVGLDEALRSITHDSGGQSVDVVLNRVELIALTVPFGFALAARFFFLFSSAISFSLTASSRSFFNFFSSGLTVSDMLGSSCTTNARSRPASSNLPCSLRAIARRK